MEKNQTSLKNKLKYLYNLKHKNIVKKMIKIKKKNSKYIEKILLKKVEKLYYKPIYQVNVLATHNNTHVSIMNYKTHYVLAKASAGSTGFKRLTKSTPYAAYRTTLKVIKKARKKGVVNTVIKIKGVSRSKKRILRVLKKNFRVLFLIDNNNYSHNGCKLKKKT